MAKITTTSYDSNWYIPSAIKARLEAGDEKVVKAEYTRLRDIAQKRLKRLKKAGFDETQLYKQNVKRFKKLKQIKSKSELSSRLSDLARFIRDPRGIVKRAKEIRDKSLSTLHSNGYTFVNEANYIEFGKFMEEYRAQKLDEMYDSGDAADAYGITVKHLLAPEELEAEFEFWLENIEAAKKLRYSSKSAGNYVKMKKRTEKKAKQLQREEYDS